MARRSTTAAEVAKQIRAALKSTGLDARVTSKNYSMGHSVSITLTDARPEIVELVNKLAGKFESGHFDGMTDSYVYSNREAKNPTVDYVHVNNDMTDATRQSVYDFIRSYFAGGAALPALYDDGKNHRVFDECVSDLVHQQFCRSGSTYWLSHNCSKVAA